MLSIIRTNNIISKGNNIISLFIQHLCGGNKIPDVLVMLDSVRSARGNRKFRTTSDNNVVFSWFNGNSKVRFINESVDGASAKLNLLGFF